MNDPYSGLVYAASSCMCAYMYVCTGICSAQSRNLRNLEIMLHIPRIQKLCANLEIAHQSQDSVAPVCNLEIVQFLLHACTIEPRLPFEILLCTSNKRYLKCNNM